MTAGSRYALEYAVRTVVRRPSGLGAENSIRSADWPAAAAITVA
jgi:hypothetical protein